MELIQNQYERFILAGQGEQQRELSTEVIVPDTRADVYTVLSASGRCQLRQKTLLADRVTLEGTVELEALCQEEEVGQWQIVRGTAPFSLEVEAAGCTEDSIAQVRLELLRCDARIRNPRKLQLQAQLFAGVQVFRRESLTVSESAAGAQEEDLQLLTESAELEVLRTVCEKKLSAADQVQPEQPGELLHYSVLWRQEEQRVLSGKVLLRGSAILQTVCVRQDTLIRQEYAIPFSQVAECEGAEPGDTVTVEYQTLQTQVTLSEGETQTLSCNLTATASLCLSRTLHLQVLRDLYSTRFRTESTVEQLACPAWRCFEEAIPAQDTCQPQEPAAQVLDCRAQARGFVGEQGRMGGMYTLRVLYRCPEGRLHTAEHTLRVLSDTPVEARCLTVCAGWRELSVQTEEGALRFRLTALLRGRGQVEQPCRQVSRGALNADRPLQSPPPGTLVLRTVQPGETAWSIAKQYGSRVGQILSANRLEPGTALIPGQLMMVPFSG